MTNEEKEINKTVQKDVAEQWERFGRAFRLIRQGSDLSMGDVARRFGVSVSFISSIEHGRDPIAEQKLSKIASTDE